MRSRGTGVIGITYMVLSGTMVAWCQGAQAQSAPSSAAPPLTLPVTAPVIGPIVRTVTLPAQVQPLHQATLYARVPGYLGSISVDKGDP